MNITEITNDLYEVLKELYKKINFTGYKYEKQEKIYGELVGIPTMWHGKIEYSEEFREKIENTIKNYENHINIPGIPQWDFKVEGK